MNRIQNVDTHALRVSAVADGTLCLANGAKPASGAQSQRNAPQGSEKEAKQKMVPLSASSHDDLRPCCKQKTFRKIHLL